MMEMREMMEMMEIVNCDGDGEQEDNDGLPGIPLC